MSPSRVAARDREGPKVHGMFVAAARKVGKKYSGSDTVWQVNHFVISCNAGCQRSVAMVCIMEAKGDGRT